MRDCKVGQPVCYNCNETGHRRPDCPKIKSGGPKPEILAPAKSVGGRPDQNRMVTRGRVHQLTGETPAANANVAGKILFKLLP